MNLKIKPAYNTQYKTVGVQWFAGVWFSLQHFCRWTRMQPENPTVSYCQPLEVMQKKPDFKTLKYDSKNLAWMDNSRKCKCL